MPTIGEKKSRHALYERHLENENELKELKVRASLVINLAEDEEV
jgi:hypothetical protein